MIISPHSWGAERTREHREMAAMSLPDPVAYIRRTHDALRPSISLGKTGGNYDAACVHLSADDKLCFAIMTYLDAVETHGHAGFFASEEGVVWQDALKGLRLIGATHHANVLFGAALRAGGEPPLDLEHRRKLLANLAPKFEELDRQAQAKSALGHVWRHFYAARFGQLAA